MAAVTMSQPADVLFSTVNNGAGDDGSLMLRLGRVADGIGMAKLCTQGLFALWLHAELTTISSSSSMRALFRSGRSDLASSLAGGHLPRGWMGFLWSPTS